MIRKGDLVKWNSAKDDVREKFDVDLGVVLRLSRTGATTRSAEILLWDGKIQWVDCSTLRIVTERKETI